MPRLSAAQPIVGKDGTMEPAFRDYLNDLFTGGEPVTVTDSAEINFTLAGQNITADLQLGSIAATKLDAGVNAALALAHAAVTVTDSAEIDFTLTGQDITASIITGSLDETKLDVSVNASLDLADSASQPGHTHNGTEVSYDNSVSGATATDTQGALDESFGDIATNAADIATVAYSFALGLAQANTLIEELQAQDDGSVVGYDALRRIKRIGWDEVHAFPLNATVGGSTTVANFGTSLVSRQRYLAVNGTVFLQWQAPRNARVGETAYFHVHWATSGTDTGLVQWDLSYTIAAGYDQETFPANTLLTTEEAASGTAWRHMTTEFSTGFVMPEPGAAILARFRRIAPSSGANADNVFATSVDIAYRTSLDDFTPQRTPDFYART
jgi:hypothetical protein